MNLEIFGMAVAREEDALTNEQLLAQKLLELELSRENEKILEAASAKLEDGTTAWDGVCCEGEESLPSEAHTSEGDTMSRTVSMADTVSEEAEVFAIDMEDPRGSVCPALPPMQTAWINEWEVMQLQ
ncbi:unnamed protein product [Effrenium voratum]|uniref:Uncharacterized protein n=1 Tax=Effrenium voratum TaxID=2562239 RepID=A0AA36JTI4_9DINO|nr:unnamed protein product [Effrenium voratum]